MESTAVRLQKFLADAGVASRRQAEKLILDGKVAVNGKVVRVLGTKVAPGKDAVSVSGKPVKSVEPKVYFMLNKPAGYMTAAADHKGRPTVMELVKHIPWRIFPVGRLDFNSEGLLIFTNDGELAQQISHPRHRVLRTYEVKVRGAVDDARLAKLRKGIRIQGAEARPESVRVIKPLGSGAWLEFILAEGKNREIRRMCAHAGLEVSKLRRVAIGRLKLRGLNPGELDMISKEDLARLVGLK